MKLKIAGSGGMFLIPNPFCKCPVCQEARIKRGRYERLGPSLYIEDIGMLIDTPEDIAVACDRQGISRIDYLSISHKDPDHTRGMRIVEPLGYDCIAGKGTPIQFIALRRYQCLERRWPVLLSEYSELHFNQQDKLC